MNDGAVWEFSKKLTFFFLIAFTLHMAAHIVSAMLTLGDYRLIKESFNGTLPFYSVIFGSYTAKAAFENYDKHKKQYEIAMKQVDCDDSLG